MRSSIDKEICGRSEAQEALAELAALEHFSFKEYFAGWSGKDEALADGDLAAGFDEGVPLGLRRVLADGFGEHDFDLAGGAFTIANKRAVGVETRWNDSAVVEDEQVSGLEQVT